MLNPTHLKNFKIYRREWVAIGLTILFIVFLIITAIINKHQIAIELDNAHFETVNSLHSANLKQGLRPKAKFLL
jgi:hypothetical protein